MLTLLIALTLSPPSRAARGTVEQEAHTSPDEKIHFAVSAIEEMWSTHAQVAEQLRASEQGQDRTLCLDEKLDDLEHLIVAAEAATLSIPLALADGERQLAELEFRKVSIALSRTRQTRQAAAMCGSEPLERAPQAPDADSAGWGGVQLD